MKKKTIIALLLATPFFFVACSGSSDEGQTDMNSTFAKTEADGAKGAGGSDAEKYDPKRGEGKFDETNVVVDKFDAAMATKGKAAAETKCMSCHKLTDEKLVGPGWKGVTSRHQPHWIMNFITNPDAMIDKDPKLQEQLELCLVRMPNQNLADTEARDILEFMRQNDGAK